MKNSVNMALNIAMGVCAVVVVCSVGSLLKSRHNHELEKTLQAMGKESKEYSNGLSEEPVIREEKS